MYWICWWNRPWETGTSTNQESTAKIPLDRWWTDSAHFCQTEIKDLFFDIIKNNIDEINFCLKNDSIDIFLSMSRIIKGEAELDDVDKINKLNFTNHNVDFKI